MNSLGSRKRVSIADLNGRGAGGDEEEVMSCASVEVCKRAGFRREWTMRGVCCARPRGEPMGMARVGMQTEGMADAVVEAERQICWRVSAGETEEGREDCG